MCSCNFSSRVEHWLECKEFAFWLGYKRGSQLTGCLIFSSALCVQCEAQLWRHDMACIVAAAQMAVLFLALSILQAQLISGKCAYLPITFLDLAWSRLHIYVTAAFSLQLITSSLLKSRYTPSRCPCSMDKVLSLLARHKGTLNLTFCGTKTGVAIQ